MENPHRRRHPPRLRQRRHPPRQRRRPRHPAGSTLPRPITYLPRARQLRSAPRLRHHHPAGQQRRRHDLFPDSPADLVGRGRRRPHPQRSHRRRDHKEPHRRLRPPQMLAPDRRHQPRHPNHHRRLNRLITQPMKPYCNPISPRSPLPPLPSPRDCLLGFSLFAIRYSLLCVLCVLCVSPSPAATINFQLERFTGHTNNRPITISLASDPLAQTTNIVFGVPTTLQPTNSRASIVLLPANYWVKIDQVPTPMFMPVPDSTNVYNAVDLIRDGLKHLIIKTNFVIIDTNALSSYLLTNGDGSSLTGLYFIPLTNGVAHGTTNIVTDSFGDVWSFDGISWRDITVGGLPQAQFLSGSYTLTLPMSLSGTDGGQLTISENDANTANLFQVRSNGVIIAYIDSASILNFSQGNITNLYSTIVNNDGVTVSGGLKNTAFTPNTIVKANGSSYAVSIPNGSGALTNNGSGVFGWYPGFLDSVSNDWLGSFTRDGSGLTHLHAPPPRMPPLPGNETTSAGSVATTLKNTGTAGTYTKITFDAQGRETSGTTLSAGDIPAIPESGVTSPAPAL